MRTIEIDPYETDEKTRKELANAVEDLLAFAALCAPEYEDEVVDAHFFAEAATKALAEDHEVQVRGVLTTMGRRFWVCRKK